MQKAGATGLIPRKKLFGNPTRAQAKISPDGQWLSWLAPNNGVLNICVAPPDDMDAARVITDDTKRGIRFHGWALDSSHVLYRTRAAPRNGTSTPSTWPKEIRAT